MGRIIVVGGGAAGLMAAGQISGSRHEVVIVERNSRPARKIMITGKGRCNLTNRCDLDAFIAAVPSNGKFLYSAFSACTSDDTISLFESLGVSLKTERGNRVFPQTDKAADIVDALAGFAVKGNNRLWNGRVKDLCIENGTVTGVVLENGTGISADKVIVATGGISYPVTGSTGDGYVLAKQVGHKVVPPAPSLIPLCVSEDWCRDLQGLSLRNIAINVVDSKGNKIYNDFGELLFTHFGLSGPVILSASARIKNVDRERYQVHIDLKPALDENALDRRILRDFSENSNRAYINALKGLLPQKLIPVVVKLTEIDPYLPAHQMTKEMRKKLVGILKRLVLTVIGTRPIEEAIVTRGGVSTREINPRTMESKLLNGLYFAGEVIDVDAYTGGFNLQIAFSTGTLAGRSAASALDGE